MKPDEDFTCDADADDADDAYDTDAVAAVRVAAVPRLNGEAEAAADDDADAVAGCRGDTVMTSA